MILIIVGCCLVSGVTGIIVGFVIGSLWGVLSGHRQTWERFDAAIEATLEDNRFRNDPRYEMFASAVYRRVSENRKGSAE